MLNDPIIRLVLLHFLLGPLIQGLQGQTSLAKPNEILVKRINSIEGLVSLWKFTEEPGLDRRASGKGEFPLKESNGKVSRVNEGPLSGYSILLDGSKYLTLSHSQTGLLNIYGDKSEVTVIAWIKWTGEQTGFVNGREQVCGHISKTGKQNEFINVITLKS